MPIQFDDEQPPQLPQTIAPAWNPQVFLDDGAGANLANFFLDYHEPAPAQLGLANATQQPNWLSQPFWYPEEASFSTPVNYYINATTGNDSNPGTFAQPWATPVPLNGKFLPPGSFVRLNGPNTFTLTGSININAPNVTIGAGIALNITVLPYGPTPVTFTSYGAGKATLQFNGDTCGFIISNTGFVTLDNLNIKGDATLRTAVFSGTPASTLLRHGVNLIHGGGGATYSNYTINSCRISGFYNGALIGINGTTGYDVGNLGNIAIKNTELTDTIWRGIDHIPYRTGPSVVPVLGSLGISITGCNFHDIQGTGNATVLAFDPSTGNPIASANWDVPLVDGNVFANNMTAGGGGPAIGTGYNITRALIQRNTVYGQSAGTGLSGDSGAIEINGGSNQVVIQKNFFHDNYGIAIGVTTDDDVPTNNVISRFNILAHNLTDPAHVIATHTSISIQGSTDSGISVNNIWFYNNIIVDNPTTNAALGATGTRFFEFGSATGGPADHGMLTGCHFFNNILYTTATGTIYETIDDTPNNRSGFSFASNAYVTPPGVTINWNWNGSTVTTLAAFGQDSTGITLNPSLLTNADGYTQDGYYKLLAGSLDVGAGVNLRTLLGDTWWDPYGFAALGLPIGSPSDYFGNPLPSAYGSGTTYFPIGPHQPTNVVMYESFGEVTAPALPATGWGAWGANFTTATTQHWADSPNSLRHNTGTFDQNWTTAADSNNGDAEVSLKFFFASVVSESAWGLTIRDDGGGGNCYQLNAEPVGSAAAGLTLTKIVGGVQSGLGSTVGPTSISLTNWYRMILSAQVNTISAYLQRLADGLWMKPDGTFQVAKITCISVTDSSITGSGVASVIGSCTGTELMYAGDFLFETLTTISDEAEVPLLSPACATQQQATNWTAAPFIYDEWGTRLFNFAMEDEPPFVPRYIDATWNAATFRDDEASGSLAGVKFDDELLFVAQYIATAWNPVIFRDDEVSVSLANFALEQQEPANPQAQAIAWNPVAFRDDEVSTALANFALEDELPFVARYMVIAWNPAVFLDDEASAHLADMGVDDELPFTAQVIANTWNPVAFRDDETSTNLANFALEDELPFTPQYLVVSWNPVTFRDDETTFPLGDFTLEQQEPFVPQTMAAPWNATTFLDDETLALLGLDDESLYVATTQAPNWNPVVFRDDEVFQTPPPTIGFDDDPDWNRATISQPWNALAFRDDEVGSQLKNFAVEDELVWTPRYLASIIDNRVFLEDPLLGTGIIPPTTVTQPRLFGGVPPDTFGGGFAVTFVGIPDENFPATGP